MLGLFYFRLLLRKDGNQEYGQRVIVWILLLMLVLFASVMWVSRATEDAAQKAVERIYEYHQNHSSTDSDGMGEKSRTEFLQKQADDISDTNILYAVVSLGVFLLSAAVIMNNYQENKVLGERLSLAESEARSAKKIAELKESISSLLNNMSALSFSKDAETGIYLACNQAFAEYAHKESPERVVGLTDAEIFDAETAAHFVESDRMALSLDEPYIFFEDVLDAMGNRRQFQTKKLKFLDDSGRMCVLGMCQDMTDMVRMKQENVATKEAYEKVRSAGIIFTHIAQTLARGYEDLYYINLENGEYIEYHVDDDSGILVEERRGEDFFTSCIQEAEVLVHPDDRAFLMKNLERETLKDTLDRNKAFLMTYRLITEDEPVYVSMKISRMEDDERFIILGITNVNEEMKQRRLAERVQEEHIAYARINALTGDFLCVYVVVPETGLYREFSSTDGFKSFEVPPEGTDFFETSRKQGRRVVCPDDLDFYLAMFTRENILSEIEQSGIFSMTYRLMLNGKPNYVQLKAAMVEENEGSRLVVGINDIDAYVRREEEYAKRLAQAQNMANIDALTGVKSRHAYLDEEERLDHLIREHRISEFAVVILDVNDLKKVNDTMGHQAGDRFIQNACKIICDIFGHSPVFRTGGDEFAVIAQAEDYACIEELLGKLSDQNTEALRNGGIVIACGMARFENDSCVADVYERADQIMYENKSFLKSAGK